MKFYKLAAASLLSLAFFASVTALEVDEDEIRSTGNEIVQFENYAGPHAIIETADAITAIGRGLGTQVYNSLNSTITVNPNAKYSVIHAIDPSETGKFDADIIFINETATVDHIRNLRRIIAGYLMSAYGYNAADASTLATFVTVYNAVYRNKLDIFQSKYKAVVTNNLTEEKCGLSTRWSQWPGNSQIVIPLFDLQSDLSSVNTSVISDQRVIDSIREQDDKGIDERKNLADLMEREADSYAEKAQEAEDRAEEERRTLEEQQKKEEEAARAAQEANKAAQNAGQDAQKAQENANKAQEDNTRAQEEARRAQEEARRAQEEARRAQEEARNNPSDQSKQDAANTAQQNATRATEDAQKAREDAQKAQEDAQKAQQDNTRAQEEARRAQEEAQRAQQKANEEQQKTNEQRTVVETIEKEAAENQAIADQKMEEAQKARTEIAKDQQKLISSQLYAANNRNAVIGLKLTDETNGLSGLVKVDAANGQVLRESPVTVVRGRTILPVTKDGTISQALPSITGSTTTLTATGSATSSTTTAGDGTTLTLDDILYMAICGENAGSNSAVKLCLLDSRNMEIQAESNEIVAEDSVLTQNGNDYYCVIKNGNDWVVGKYDGKLNLLLKSPFAVRSDTPITVTPVGIIVTAANYQTVLLSLKDLKPITDTKTGGR